MWSLLKYYNVSNTNLSKIKNANNLPGEIIHEICIYSLYFTGERATCMIFLSEVEISHND